MRRFENSDRRKIPTVQYDALVIMVAKIGMRWMGGLASHPDFAAFEMFLLPNRNDFLDPVD